MPKNKPRPGTEETEERCWERIEDMPFLRKLEIVESEWDQPRTSKDQPQPHDETTCTSQSKLIPDCQNTTALASSGSPRSVSFCGIGEVPSPGIELSPGGNLSNLRSKFQYVYIGTIDPKNEPVPEPAAFTNHPWPCISSEQSSISQSERNPVQDASALKNDVSRTSPGITLTDAEKPKNLGDRLQDVQKPKDNSKFDQELEAAITPRKFLLDGNPKLGPTSENLQDPKQGNATAMVNCESQGKSSFCGSEESGPPPKATSSKKKPKSLADILPFYKPKGKNSKSYQRLETANATNKSQSHGIRAPDSSSDCLQDGTPKSVLRVCSEAATSRIGIVLNRVKVLYNLKSKRESYSKLNSDDSKYERLETAADTYKSDQRGIFKPLIQFSSLKKQFQALSNEDHDKPFTGFTGDVNIPDQHNSSAPIKLGFMEQVGSDNPVSGRGSETAAKSHQDRQFSTQGIDIQSQKSSVNGDTATAVSNASPPNFEHVAIIENIRLRIRRRLTADELRVLDEITSKAKNSSKPTRK